MSVSKTLVFVGCMGLALMAEAAMHRASAVSLQELAAPIVIAQNDSNNQGFWSRLFNKPNNNGGAKPLFLDGSNTSTGQPTSSSIKPYHIGPGRNAGYSDGMTADQRWAVFEAQREEQRKRNNEMAMAAGLAGIAESERALQRMAEAEARGENPSESARKIQVYDPKKAWTYDPNKNSSTNTDTPRLYNTR